jgi:hypothetical protein
VSEAWFGFLGVIVGAAVSLIGEQYTTRREREARRALLSQEQKDRRDAFQRDTILALQDALIDLSRAVRQEWRAMLAEHAASGRWPTKTAAELGPAGAIEAYWTIGSLRSRVSDPELRSLAGEIREMAYSMIYAHDIGTLVDRLKQENGHMNLFNERVTVLLADLF